jgi:hypothetical protein
MKRESQRGVVDVMEKRTGRGGISTTHPNNYSHGLHIFDFNGLALMEDATAARIIMPCYSTKL